MKTLKKGKKKFHLVPHDSGRVLFWCETNGKLTYIDHLETLEAGLAVWAYATRAA